MPLAALLTITAAALYGGVNAWTSSEREVALAFYALGFAILIPYLFEYKKTALISLYKCRALGCIFLITGLGIAFLGYNNLALTFMILAPILYFGTFPLFVIALLPIIIWSLIIPHTEYLHFTLSYPFRLVGSQLSAILLSIGGFDAVAKDTVVEIGGRPIAITAACSGIEQLEAMLFMGWVIAVYVHKSTMVRLMHFITILPIILLVNTLRITITLVGCELYGEKIFLSDDVHTGMGFAAVAVIVILFILASSLFEQIKKEIKTKEDKSEEISENK